MVIGMGLVDFIRKRTESIASAIAYGSGKRVVMPRNGLFNSALWSCVVNLARLYATLPWHAYRIDANGDRVPESGTILAELLKHPNAYMTDYDFRFVMGFNFEMRGESVAIIKRSRAGLPIALWPVSPSSIVASSDGNILKYTYALTGETYSAEDILILRNTPVGYGAGTVLDPMYFARNDIELADKCKAMQAEYYDGASVVGNTISVPQNWDDKTKDKLRQMFNENRGFRNYIIDERIKITPIQVQNADIAKLSEAQKWSAQEVARRFNVPPFFIGDTTGTYNNSEQQGMQMVTYCLQPRITAWEAALNNALCRQREYIKFSLEGLLRGDHATRAAFYHNAIMDGWYSINEVRQKEEMPGIGPDGDVHFFPMNYGNLRDVVSGKYANGTNGMGSLWNLPAGDDPDKPEGPVNPNTAVGKIVPKKKESIEESRARLRAEKRRHDLMFVEEAQKPAKSNRAKLEKLIRAQLKDSIAELRRLVATGAPAASVVSDFKAWLEANVPASAAAYKAVYLDVLQKMVPVIKAETGKDDDVPESGIDSYAGMYADGMAERVSGMTAKVASTSVGTDHFEDDISAFEQDYPIDQSEEEVNRSSNAFSVWLFQQLHLSVFHVVAASNSCGFCGTLDGKVASVEGYVLQKGTDVDTGEGGIRHIDKDYRHPPFHSHCRCSVAPGE